MSVEKEVGLHSSHQSFSSLAPMSKEVREQISSWVFGALTEKKAELSDLSPCPYASEAMLKKQVRLFESLGAVEMATRELLDKFHSLDARVAVVYESSTTLSLIATQQLVQTLRDEFYKNNLWLMFDHPDQEETVGSVDFSFEKGLLFFVQKLSDVCESSDSLQARGYYKNWSADYYDRVVGRRQVYYEKYLREQQKGSETKSPDHPEMFPSKTFCIYPYTHLNVRPNGGVSICNRSDPIDKLEEVKTLSNFWRKNSHLDHMKDQQRKGEWPTQCRACYDLEQSGAKSYRQEALDEESIHYEWFKEKFDQGYRIPGDYPVRELELRFGNHCNLKCKICSPIYSSKWEAELKRNSDFAQWIQEDSENNDIYDPSRVETRQTTEAINNQIIDSLDDSIFELSQVMFSGGEPLIQRDHFRSLEKLLPNAHNIALEYTTNLNVLNFEKYNALDLWKNFKRVSIRISLDADPHLYPFVREGGSIRAVEENIRRIRQELSPNQFMVFATCTTSVYNVSRLPEIFEYFMRLPVYVHTSIVEYPTFLSPQVLPAPLKAQAIQKIRNYLDGFTEGIVPVDPQGFVRASKQFPRVNKWMGNVLAYLEGGDQSDLWEQFLKFNSFFDHNNETLLSYYPEWREFVGE